MAESSRTFFFAFLCVTLVGCSYSPQTTDVAEKTPDVGGTWDIEAPAGCRFDDAMTLTQTGATVVGDYRCNRDALHLTGSIAEHDTIEFLAVVEKEQTPWVCRILSDDELRCETGTKDTTQNNTLVFRKHVSIMQRIVPTDQFYSRFCTKRQEPRGEFETKEAFDARFSKPLDTVDRFVLLEVDQGPRKQDRHSYDIDRERLVIARGSSNPYYVRKDADELVRTLADAEGTKATHKKQKGLGVVLSSASNITGRYEAKNAFNATTTVTKWLDEAYVLKVVNFRDLPQDVFNATTRTFHFAVKATPQGAKALSEEAKIVIGIRPISYQQGLMFRIHHEKPTYLNPRESVTMAGVIGAEVVVAMLYDPVADAILSKWERP